MNSSAKLCWKDILQHQQQQPYYKSILAVLESQRGQGITIYPPKTDMLNAFTYTPLDSVRVVILGQDPYHGPKQAHGLSFSVPKGIRLPPSLRNIFKAIEYDLGITPPAHGCLIEWAKNGVLLLNTHLSVCAGQARSHANLGWERFTDSVISCLDHHPTTKVFLLWGAHAQKKAQLIQQKQHLILTAPHPSPLSAHRGFITCKHFSKANAWLEQHQRGAIDWQLAE